MSWLRCLAAIWILVLVLSMPGNVAAQERQLCGDANCDMIIDIMDVVYLLNYIFMNGSEPPCVLDSNADGVAGPKAVINVADVRKLIEYLFFTGPAPSNCDNTTEDWAILSDNLIIIGAPPYSVYPGGDSIAIPVYISNTFNITALSLGFSYVSRTLVYNPYHYHQITSVDWTGSVFNAQNRYQKFDVARQTVLIGGIYIGTPSSLPPQSNGLLVTLNARIADIFPPPATDDIYLGRAFVPPAGDFIFVDSGANMYRPYLRTPYEPYIVTHTDDYVDQPIGSFHRALDSADFNSGPDTIRFALSDTITPAHPLPTLTGDDTYIFGSSAPKGSRSVIIDGRSMNTREGNSPLNDVIVIQGSNNTVEGLTIIDSPDNGVAITGALANNNAVLKCLFRNNGGLGIDLGDDGLTLNDVDDVDDGPNELFNYPVIDSVVPDIENIDPYMAGYVYGTAPGSSIIHLFVAQPAGVDSLPPDESHHGEAYEYIDSTLAEPDGKFSVSIPEEMPMYSIMTATATDMGGMRTSEFSENFALTPRPLIIVAYSPVNLKVTDPYGNFIGRDAQGNLEQTLFPATYTEITNDSIHIFRPVVGEYDIDIISEDGADPDAIYSVGVRIDGTAECILVMEQLIPPSGMITSLGYTVESEWHYINGDVDRNGLINIIDIIYLIDYKFKGGPAPDPAGAGDTNCNLVVNIIDIIYLIDYKFKGGPAPCEFDR